MTAIGIAVVVIGVATLYYAMLPDMVLRRVNSVRFVLHQQRLERLESGYRLQPSCCPVANSLGQGFEVLRPRVKIEWKCFSHATEVEILEAWNGRHPPKQLRMYWHVIVFTLLFDLGFYRRYRSA